MNWGLSCILGTQLYANKNVMKYKNEIHKFWYWIAWRVPGFLPANNIGFFSSGRWLGTAYCQRLTRRAPSFEKNIDLAWFQLLRNCWTSSYTCLHLHCGWQSATFQLVDTSYIYHLLSKIIVKWYFHIGYVLGNCHYYYIYAICLPPYVLRSLGQVRLVHNQNTKIMKRTQL